ncbi:triose-phosphate isomerase [Candidatus Poribacteria bacterium]|nr:triose-phosphate isomerase [Candidatus Poribacteria bacterium]MYF56378.1 triose-phosphate isomerase [Candidatus Poribacteria bacterium]MYI93835.1 triose-phosphate isomerase [Candidatus Poribacteria bacterium]
MRTPIIAGNWKLNNTVSEAIELVTGIKRLVANTTDVEIVVAPTFTALAAVYEVIQESNISLAAQDVYWENSGAFTGEISPTMLKDVGCEYVIIGHSERRQFFAETNESVNLKTKAALTTDLKPIICVGEQLKDREAGNTEKIIENHVSGGIKDLSADQMLSCVIAYEPVWAIGTGKTATPKQAQEVHAYIRQLISEVYTDEIANQVRIQYGGSVKPDNAAELMSQPDVDGALVGGASLQADSFAHIVKSSINGDL